jgi:uncharacterized membrane protein YccC
MQVNAATVPVEPPPLVFAGFPASSWAFAVRIWLACLLALYASFWLELESPSSSAITVAILALPTRGQGMEKAGFRLLATVIGVAASIAIAGMFSQTGPLLLAVFSIWVGLCVYAVGMLDGNRAYAAALCCITVGLIAIQQIDTPLQVFPTGLARGAALAVGVLALALINDVLFAPDYHPVLATRLETLHGRVIDYAGSAVRGPAMAASAAAEMLRTIVAMRPEIASLVTESSSGTARSAAARSVMVDLVTGLFLSRAQLLLSGKMNERDRSSTGLLEMCRTWLGSEVARNDADVRSGLQALQDGVDPARQWRAPLYRSRRIAVEGGIRAAINFALIAAFFVVTGWPSTELCLSLVAVIIAFGSAAPDQRVFTKMAVAATAAACLIAGILKYFVFNGVSDFQLLAIGLAPVVIGLSLLMSMPNSALSPLGRLTLVFTLAIFMPTNPQSYDPTVFIITCLLSLLSAILTFVALLIVPPVSGDRKLALLMREVDRDLKRPSARPSQHLAVEEATFRDATRIVQILAASGTSASHHVTVDHTMACFDRTVALWHCIAELDRLAHGPLAAAVRSARAALALRDGDQILGAAGALHEAAAQHHVGADSACAALVLASIAFNPSPPAAASTETRQP